MLIGQAGSIGGKTRQDVEMEQREKGKARKEEAHSSIPVQTTKKQDITCPAVKGTEPCG